MSSNHFRPQSRLLCLAASALLLSACQPATAPAGSTSATPATVSATTAPPSTLAKGEILAGKGIKGVSLDQTKTEIEKTLGAPEEVDSNEYAPGVTYALYYSKGIELNYTDDKLNAITLHKADEKWKAYSGGTEQGLGVGSTVGEISSALGEPDQGEGARALRYRKQGLWFRLDDDKTSDSARAESLQVMKPE